VPLGKWCYLNDVWGKGFNTNVWGASVSTNSNVVELVAAQPAAEMPKPILPSGLIALTGIAAYFRIAADPTLLIFTEN
jgi:hypothetical protein